MADHPAVNRDVAGSSPAAPAHHDERPLRLPGRPFVVVRYVKSNSNSNGNGNSNSNSVRAEGAEGRKGNATLDVAGVFRSARTFLQLF
jgi:hypothetical protein